MNVTVHRLFVLERRTPKMNYVTYILAGAAAFLVGIGMTKPDGYEVGTYIEKALYLAIAAVVAWTLYLC